MIYLKFLLLLSMFYDSIKNIFLGILFGFLTVISFYIKLGKHKNQ